MENWTESEQSKEQTPAESTPQQPQMPPTGRRHGCVVTWLILLIVGNAISSLVSITMSEMMAKMDGVDYLNPPYYEWSGYIGLITIAGTILLYRKRKLGFHLVVISSMFSAALLFWVTRQWTDALVPFIGVAVLYWILQITRDGETAWRQLE